MPTPGTSPAALLEEKFGHTDFLPGQEKAIESLLAGHSVAAVFPTGGGKSLCYQLPALVLDGLTLVVSPLIALMKDQIDALTRRGIAAARLDSTLDADGVHEVMDAARDGKLRLLYVAPERFNNERFREAIRELRIACFAVDEAHCISEWGHNFRPDYLKLAEFARVLKAERVLALTATATPEVLEDICARFAIEPAHAVRTPFYRSNLTLIATPVTPRDRDGVLIERLRSRPTASTIVYVTLQKTAAAVAARLAQDGVAARAYHAGLGPDTRAEVQDWFMTTDSAVVVATIAFGMGIDKANIRYVYHYNLPKSLENYAQEIGRAGRDGEPATCEMLASLEDLAVLENFAYGDTPSREGVSAMVENLFSDPQEEIFDLSLSELSLHCDIRPLVLRTLLTYLELDGFLEGGTPFYANYRFKPLKTSKEILAAFDGEQREFLAEVFRSAESAKVWFTLDVHRIAARLGCARERVVSALDNLSAREMLELKVAGVRNRYRRLSPVDNLESLVDSLHGRMLEREERELARLQEVLEWAYHDGCQASALGEHFGEPLEEPCGHCSWCQDGQRTDDLPERASPAIDEEAWQQVEAVRRDHSDVLGDPRALARWLCGVSSPKLTRAKLMRHPLFGTMAGVPFGELLAAARR